jgi:homoserine kinase
MESVCIRVPATTANLGPGFDSLGMALDLWNETIFERCPQGIHIDIQGEGAEGLARNAGNLIAQSALRVFAMSGHLPAPGLVIRCKNDIPLGSGLGSSAAAVLCGLLGGNEMLDEPLDHSQILELATEIEGHPDNVAPGLLGGLVISTTLIPTPTDVRPPIVARRVDVPCLSVAVVVPAIDLPTRASRAALPVQVAIRDAVFNIGRVALVVEALRSGDLGLLGQVMDDRLHQPYRLKLIPGAESAIRAAKHAGAAAAALSGAGPGIVAFTRDDAAKIADVMVDAFLKAGVHARGWALHVTAQGATVDAGAT